VVKLLATRFVPVAIDQHIHRSRKDAEGELFGKVLKQAGRSLSGYAQGVYLFAPDGKLLAFSNTADGGHVKRLMDRALKDFRPSESTVVAGAKSVLPEPPEGGLVADVITKMLGGYSPAESKVAERYKDAVGRDHLWLRKDEAESLARGVLSESLKKRIVRYHLIDNTRGEPPMWREDEIKKLDLTIKEGRLVGSVHLETKSGDRGYRADLLGVVETKGGKVVRFDLLAKGLFWGEGTFTRGAPKGRFPLAVAFTLSEGKAPADRVPPQGARGNVKGYLR